MKRGGYLLLVMLIANLSGPAPAMAQPHAVPPVYEGCAQPPSSYKHSYYVDPAAAGGDGSAATPFRQIAQALAAARSGDVVYLRSGRYGALELTGEKSDFITIAAEPGQKPVVDSLTIHAASHWIVSELEILGPAPGVLRQDGWQAHDPKVKIDGATDIVLDRNTIATTLGAYRWAPEVHAAAVQDELASGILATQVSCTAIVGNTIKNVFTALSIGGDQSNGRGRNILIRGNRIDDFAGDGIDHQATRIRIEANAITNGHDLCNNLCIHHDGIQGWNWNDWPGLLNADVTITGNLILQQTRPNLAYVAVDLQGITIFDGNWDRVEISNNVIVTTAWHGLTMFGTQNSRIVNNTVLSSDLKRTAWIMVAVKKGEAHDAAYHVVVRNNVASTLNFGPRGSIIRGVQADHNVVTPYPESVVVRFDPDSAQYDLHLRPGSPAKGAGIADMAPPLDIDGKPRAGRIDAGAYAANVPVRP